VASSPEWSRAGRLARAPPLPSTLRMQGGGGKRRKTTEHASAYMASSKSPTVNSLIELRIRQSRIKHDTNSSQTSMVGSRAEGLEDVARQRAQLDGVGSQRGRGHGTAGAGDLRSSTQGDHAFALSHPKWEAKLIQITLAPVTFRQNIDALARVKAESKSSGTARCYLVRKLFDFGTIPHQVQQPGHIMSARREEMPTSHTKDKAR